MAAVPRAPAPVLLIALLGCAPVDAKSGDDSGSGSTDDPAATAGLVATPGVVALGPLAVGATATATVTVHNPGPEAVDLSAPAVADAAGLSVAVSPPTATTLPAGGSQELALTATATATGALGATLVLAPADPALAPLEVPVQATGTAAALSITPDPLAVPAAPPGCSSTTPVFFESVGTAPLTITDVALDDPGGRFSLSPPPGESLPWTLAPGAAKQLSLAWQADTLETDTAVLHATLDDGSAVSAPVSAAPTTPRWVDDTTTLADEAVVDVVLTIDRSSSMAQELAAFTSALGALLDGLGSHDWRLAIAVQNDGCIVGDTPFVDRDPDPAAALVALETMLEGGGTPAVDAERAFTLLAAALDADAPGGCNAGLLREGATLQLVGVSDEPEQSTGPWTDWVAQLQAVKADPDDVVFHGIGGLLPSSCGTIETYVGMREAAAATLGSFQDLCSPDLAATATALGAAATAPPRRYAPSETPVDGTLSVWVDGTDRATGWAWDGDAVVFDADAAPGWGSTVVLRYVAAEAC